tara:strand:+ start:1308 stop:1562 length:255 start_codon:yes stop_codon:yes gene_type:complete
MSVKVEVIPQERAPIEFSISSDPMLMEKMWIGKNNGLCDIKIQYRAASQSLTITIFDADREQDNQLAELSFQGGVVYVNNKEVK